MANYTTRFSCLLPVGAGKVRAALALYARMREELAAGSRIAKIHRVLLPVRRRRRPRCGPGTGSCSVPSRAACPTNCWIGSARRSA